MKPELTDEVVKLLVKKIDLGLVPTYRGAGCFPLVDVTTATQGVFAQCGLSGSDDDHPPTVDSKIAWLTHTIGRLEWSGMDARARGLRRLAVAQLGSASLSLGVAEEVVRQAAELLLTWGAPVVLRGYARLEDLGRGRASVPRWWQPEKRRQFELHRRALLEAAQWYAAYDAREDERARPDIDWWLAGCGGQVMGSIHAAARALEQDTGNSSAAFSQGMETIAEFAAPRCPKDRDALFAAFAEQVVALLIRHESPGAAFLATFCPGQPANQGDWGASGSNAHGTGVGR